MSVIITHLPSTRTLRWLEVRARGIECVVLLSHLAFASAYLVGRAVTVIVVRVIKSFGAKNRHDTVKQLSISLTSIILLPPKESLTKTDRLV